MYLSRVLLAYFVSFVSLPALKAQLNPSDAPRTTWSPNGLTEYEKIVSTCNLDAYVTDTKRWDLLPDAFTHDAVGSYTAGANISHGLAAITEVHILGTKGFITQHALTNFLVSITDDCKSANASYFAIATLFTNPQVTSGQHVNLYGYYNSRLVKTRHGWRINYIEYRFFGPGWTGNLTVLPPGHPVAPPASFEPPGFDPSAPADNTGTAVT